LVAKRNTLHWDKVFNLLAEPNKVWTKDAALLVVVVSRKNFEHNEKHSITHQYDAGAAWENLALEASSRGLVVHGMQGFDYEKARIDLEIPDNFDVMAMIAIGKMPYDVRGATLERPAFGWLHGFFFYRRYQEIRSSRYTCVYRWFLPGPWKDCEFS
jgi:nitroreductase